MPINPTRAVLRALLSGLVLSACGGVPDEAGLAPVEETLGTQESALDCSGASVTNLTIDGLSSWGGVVSGGGSWSVVYPANGVYLDFYIDGVLRGTKHVQGDANRAGSWSFSDSPWSCGSHSFEVRAYPAILDSSSPSPGKCTGGAMVKTSTFAEACPTASLSCSRTSTTTVTCTGSGGGGTGGPYTALWQSTKENYDTGTTYRSGWSQGLMTKSFSCPQKTSIEYPYNGELLIEFKARDANGLQSAVLSRSYICVF